VRAPGTSFSGWQRSTCCTAAVEWLRRWDRRNQEWFDAQRRPAMPSEPAVVLHAIDPNQADGYLRTPPRLVLDDHGPLVVPWGWSVHPLDLGLHELTIWASPRFAIVRSGYVTTRVELTPDAGVIQLDYRPRFFGGPGRLALVPIVDE